MHEELFWTDSAPVGTISGRLRIENGRLRDDSGYVQWRGISEFDLVHLVRTGREAEAQRRISRAVSIGRRNIFRVFCRAAVLFDLDHRQPGYWDACDRVLEMVQAAGARAEYVACCDAQGLPQSERISYLEALCTRYRDNPAFILQIANEPFKNGWDGALDPGLLDLAERAASILGHRDFSIGDPQDGDDEDASAETARQCVELARHSNIIVIHSSRKDGVVSVDERFRRWIDHLESFEAIMAQCQHVNPDAWGCHDEPMGFAGVPFVADHVRETDPEAALAGELTAQMIGCGFTYHYIAFQDDSTPGLDLCGAFAPQLPADPSWRYLNDSWAGSPTRGFTGYGKVRHWTNGAQAFTLASGRSKGSVSWANGFTPTQTLFDGAHVTVWAVSRP